MPTGTEPTVIGQLEATRQADRDAWDKLIDEREQVRTQFEERTKSEEFQGLDEETRTAEIKAYRDDETAFRAESDRYNAADQEITHRINTLKGQEERRQQAADASKGSPALRITSEPLTYRSDNTRGEAGLSWYRDLAMVEAGVGFQTGGTKDEARNRLEQHAREMKVLIEERQKVREAEARRQVAEAEADFLARASGPARDTSHLLRELRSNGLQFSPFEQRVTPNSTDGYGGYFIPPDWLVSEFIPGLRAHLIAAGLCRQMDLPSGTNSVLIPKLNQLTIVGYQQANNAGLPSQDWTDTFVQASAKTIGGYSDVALQLLEQSPDGVVDEVITTDLMAAYNQFLDLQVIAGDGTSVNQLNGGHILGLYPYTNWSANNVTFTSGSPLPYMMPMGVFGPSYGKIASTRFDTTGYKQVVHGSRWAWYSNGPDANYRPLGETAAGGRYNIAAAINGGLQAEGLVGFLPTLADSPVYSDNNIPVTDTTGGGTNQDVAIGGLFDDAWLFKSPLRTEVFREVLSGSLGVRFRIYNYAAFLVRYGQSFAVATGSGFAKPATGYGDYFR